MVNAEDRSSPGQVKGRDGLQAVLRTGEACGSMCSLLPWENPQRMSSAEGGFLWSLEACLKLLPREQRLMIS